MPDRPVQIVTFVMPWEIDEYARTIDLLKMGSHSIDRPERVGLDVTLCLSDQLFNWDRSRLPKEFFTDRFTDINRRTDWSPASRFHIEEGGSIQGVCAKRRQNIVASDPRSFILWLDPDVVFPPHALPTTMHCLDAIRDDYFILTPQITRMWDSSWDPLVADRFKSQPLGFCYEHDVQELATRADEGNCAPHPIQDIKFGGGCFVSFPAHLLKLVGIPDRFQPYGWEDGFVMVCCRRLKTLGFPVRQFVIDNLVVGQDFRYRATNPYLNDLAISFDKDAMSRFNRSIFDAEVEKAVLRVLNQRSLTFVQRCLLGWSALRAGSARQVTAEKP